MTHEHESGWPTGVLDGGPGAPSWATVEYHDSGLWKSVLHSNGVRENATRDADFTRRISRLHTTGVTPSADNFDSGAMAYDGAGNLKAAGGDVYVYDGVNRLVSADVGGWSQDFEYDRFGNLTFNNFDPETPAFTVDESTNRIASGVYDDSGNLLRYHAWNWRYDTQNQVIAQGASRYVYDAFNERVASFSIGGSRFTLRDLTGRRLSTVDLVNSTGAWSRQQDFIYFGDRLVASQDWGDMSDQHFHLDHLGSTRLLSRSDGSVAAEFQQLPYGEDPERGYYGHYETDALFTGHERDASTGSYYMHARHYHPSLGRFNSVDPLAGDPSQPQTLNRYAYTAGNPINRIDPDGKFFYFVWIEIIAALIGMWDSITVTDDLPPAPSLLTFGPHDDVTLTELEPNGPNLNIPEVPGGPPDPQGPGDPGPPEEPEPGPAYAGEIGPADPTTDPCDAIPGYDNALAVLDGGLVVAAALADGCAKSWRACAGVLSGQMKKIGPGLNRDLFERWGKWSPRAQSAANAGLRMRAFFFLKPTIHHVANPGQHFASELRAIGTGRAVGVGALAAAAAYGVFLYNSCQILPDCALCG